MEKKTTKCLGSFSLTSSSGGGTGGSGAVDSVNGKTGNVVITKADIGLSHVNNTSDLEKPISTAVGQELTLINDDLSELSTKVDGVATLDSTGKIPASQLPENTSSTLSSNISGSNVTVAYYDNYGEEQTETLNSFCQATKSDLVNLVDLEDRVQPEITQTTKENLKEASSVPGHIVYLIDQNCLAYSTGTAWKKISLEDLD